MLAVVGARRRVRRSRTGPRRHRQERLCARCVNPDPGFWGRCPACEVTWQLSPKPCLRCILLQKIRSLLGDHSGVVRPDLGPLRQALSSVERPDTALAWISRPIVQGLLTELRAA